MILQNMYPGETREIDCHCIKCQATMIVKVKQQYHNEIIVVLMGANEKKIAEIWWKKTIYPKRKDV
jgi:hypothetical protein